MNTYPPNNENICVVQSQVQTLHLVICDDEPEQIELMTEMLQKLEQDTPFLIESFSCAKDLLSELLTRSENGTKMPDIIFSDIKMPDVDGITFGKRLCQLAPESFLVFTTAYAEYAIQGYEARAYRYLLKPISADTIREIIQDVLLEIGNRYRLVIKAKEEYMVPLKDVIYLGAEDKYTVIYTTMGYHVTRISLLEYEKMLECYGFFRIHRKYLVNTFHHFAIGNGKITLSNGQELPISRRKKDSYYENVMKRLEKNLLK